jgi:hypothetical protein
MKTPHKHKELIIAWANGAEIEYYSPTFRKWKSIFKGWSWDSQIETQYRIKPEPKPDTEDFVSCKKDSLGLVFTKSSFRNNLKLTFDGETGKLKSAEVI